MAATSMMRSAVVLCSHNGGAYLPAQLASLAAQTRQPDCWVLSDDASTDNSPDLLDTFAQTRRREGAQVILHRNHERMGYIRHFEAALARAPAEVLFCCDQDDVWHPDKIAHVLPMFAADDALLLVHTDARLVDEAGESLGATLFEVLELGKWERHAMQRGQAFDVLIRRNIVTGATMAVRHAAYVQALPFAAHWAHDEWMALVAAMHGRVATVHEALIDYRQHGGNQLGVRARTPLERTTGIGARRHAYLQRIQVRYAELLASSAYANADPLHQVVMQQRMHHAQTRARMAARSPLLRVGPALRELMGGRYRRFGNGLRSALVDVAGID